MCKYTFITDLNLTFLIQIQLFQTKLVLGKCTRALSFILVQTQYRFLFLESYCQMKLSFVQF